jgi:hypothetical protein
VAVLSEVQFAVINTAATATIVAAQAAGVKIRVVGLVLINTTAQSVTLKSGAAGTAITGPLPLAALGQLVLPFNPQGYFETAAATLLELSLSGGTQVGGVLQWVAVS